MRKIRILLLGALSGACLFFLIERASVRAVSAGAVPSRDSELLARVVNLIKDDYLEVKDPVQTMDGSFRGLVNSLDAGCAYLDAGSTTRYQSQKSRTLRETGLILYKRFGAFPQVVGLIDNSPAAKAGIEIGDSVAEINGVGTAPMSLTEANLFLCDTAATPAAIKIVREDKTLEYKVDRVEIVTQPVSYLKRDGTAGILRVLRLTPAVAADIKTSYAAAIRKLRKPLVLDLRGCSEGTLDAARELVNVFLKADSIGYIAGRGDSKETVSAVSAPALDKTPLIVWVDQATIGPAEAVAAVLKDFHRAKVVGLRTAGLVAREDFVPLDDGTSVLLTSGVFCLRSGTPLWGQGVEPDVKVESGTPDFDAFFKKTLGLLTSP